MSPLILERHYFIIFTFSFLLEIKIFGKEYTLCPLYSFAHEHLLTPRGQEQASFRTQMLSHEGMAPPGGYLLCASQHFPMVDNNQINQKPPLWDFIRPGKEDLILIQVYLFNKH